ncbi:MAG: NeuD/PglB/VioB family sugar acetyltransferase [Actinobacteria bacterium]|nr:NeuD/PglB/VioB family sugar acetyltransferase [Actinomycetota bacterium]
MTTIALVPARGGSKGLPGKNLARVAGRTLVARAVQVAAACPEIDEIVVSSDDDAILHEGEVSGATPLRRPAQLATDEAPTLDVVAHLLAERPDADLLVLLQPTSPLRSPDDVQACLRSVGSAPVAVTVTPVEHPIEWTFRLGTGGELLPASGWDGVVGRRQDASSTYRLTGAVYVARAEHLRAGGALVGPGTVGIVTPRARAIDVDDHHDLLVARILAAESGDGSKVADEVVLFGGGGHARAVADALGRMGTEVVAIVDPAADRAVEGVRVVTSDPAGIELTRELGVAAVVAIGDNATRRALCVRISNAGVSLPPIVARTATVARDAQLGSGSVVLEHAHVGPGARVGAAAIVNTHSVVEHGCVVGPGAHVAPGAVLNGGVEVGDEALVGAGAVALPLSRVGRHARVGAGAVVRDDVPDHVTVAGVPARTLGPS